MSKPKLEITIDTEERTFNVINAPWVDEDGDIIYTGFWGRYMFNTTKSGFVTEVEVEWPDNEVPLNWVEIFTKLESLIVHEHETENTRRQ